MAISKIPAAGIAADAITAAKLGDNVINSEHYAADSIDAEHLAPNSVNTDSIIDDAVRTAHIQDSQVTVAKLAANSVDSSELINGSVDRVHLAADIVDGTKIADDVINSEHLVAGSIDTEHLGDDQVTAAKLANSINTDIATGPAALPKAGGTMTGHTLHGDNINQKFGAGSDLQIYHNGSNSYINNTTGSLYIRDSAGDIYIQAKNNEHSIVANNDGSVDIYYDNAKKFETTSAGVTVSGNSTVTGFVNATGSGTAGGIQFADGNAMIYRATNDMAFKLQGSEKMRITSAGKIGINETAPLGFLHIKNGDSGQGSINAAGNSLVLESNGGTGITFLSGSSSNTSIVMGDSESNYQGLIIYDHSSNMMKFGTAGTVRMSITDNGTIGIGNNIPNTFSANANNLVIGTGSGSEGMTIYSGNSNAGNIFFADSADNNEETRGGISYQHNGNKMQFRTNDGNRMVIMSDGKVGINVTAPERTLHVKPSTNEDTGVLAETHSAGDAMSIYSKGSSSHNWATGLDNDGSGGNGFSIAYKANGYPSLSSNSRVTIHTTGQMVVPSGVRIGGDDAAHTLDDYEEGNWTPVIGGTSQSGQSYEGQTGRYTKIGRQVFCSAYVALSNEGSISGFLRIKGFPFGVDPTNIGGVAFAYTSNWLLSSGHWIEGWVYTDNLIYLYETNGSGGATQLSSDHCTNNSRFAMTFSFQTND